MQICLVTPAPAASRAGNRNTALRWARLLREAGHRVRIATEWRPAVECAQEARAPSTLLLALHARRSHASIARFRALFPARPIVLALTGTDIYRDLKDDADARLSLDLADRLIVLQHCALDELPPLQHSRTRVVRQSAPAAPAVAPLASCHELCVVGHLRAEKDPLRAARALAVLPAEGMPWAARLRITHVGRALDPALEREARAAMLADPRYRWLGEVPPWRARRLIARSHAMIISSRMEGGANVVSEAITAGTPVLASRIPGNVGLLGADWPAFFDVEDHRALGALIARLATEAAFETALRAALGRLAPSVSEAQERASLLAVVDEAIDAAAGSS